MPARLRLHHGVTDRRELVVLAARVTSPSVRRSTSRRIPYPCLAPSTIDRRIRKRAHPNEEGVTEVTPSVPGAVQFECRGITPVIGVRSATTLSSALRGPLLNVEAALL